MLKRTVVSLFAVVVIGVVALGCGDDDDDGGSGGSEEVTVGVVLKDLGAQFWQQVEAGAEAGAVEGVEIDLSAATSEVDVTGQIDKIEAALTKGVDALVVAPTVPEQLLPALERAVSDDIPVVLVDTDIPEFEDSTSYVGTENYEAGTLAGKYIDEQLNGKGKLGMLISLPGVTSVDDREAGVLETLSPGIEVVNGQNTECAREKGLPSAENLLTAHPDVDAIFGSCAEPLKTAVKAIEAAGISFDDLLTVGFDADEESLEQVRNGELDALVTQFPARMGQLAVETAAAAARGETVEKFVDSGSELVTKENVDEIQENLFEP